MQIKFRMKYIRFIIAIASTLTAMSNKMLSVAQEKLDAIEI